MIRGYHNNVAITALPILHKNRAEAADIIASVLVSPPMQALRFLFDRRGLQVGPQPIVYKDLSESLVRLMFPVTGQPIAAGAVVSVVCLFDRRANRTLYAHPMHAGPEVNPLVRHLDGPMASPKPQSDADGNRANLRIIEHKRALWDRFLEELSQRGAQEAGRRWRQGYYWSLKRLYFCCGCSQCKWGSPFFDGPDPSLPNKAIVANPANFLPLSNKGHRAIVASILSSEAWHFESTYVQRGGYTVMGSPLLLKALDPEFVRVVFPTNALLLQAGVLVAVAFTYHLPSQRVVFSHCLCAGQEADIQFLRGDVAFGLPQPQPGTAGEHARVAYRSWRHQAWSQFWINELECGLAFASETWLQSFWVALEALFAGNELSCPNERRATLIRREEDHEPADDRRETVLPPQALENTGGRCFAGHTTNHLPGQLRALELSTLMVNLGWRCNQACGHCHVDAGPDRTEEMTRQTVDLVLGALRRFGIHTLDITGGAPEMNPHFRHLARTASQLGCRVIDRCNLTIFFEPGYEDLPEFLAEHGIQVTASLPSDQAEVADRQRGAGSFAKSIAALQRLNELGYGQPEGELTLNLVYNPSGVDLGAPQDAMQQRYKRELFDRYGIVFDRLFVMNNMPIHRFEHFLRREGQWTDYMDRLVAGFNPAAADGLMCRRTLSVGYDGRLYDCDFNQMMDLPLSDGLPAHIGDLDASLLQSRVIHTASHCFGCTAGAGSSCNGALVAAIDHASVHDRDHGLAKSSATREAGA